MSDFIIEYLENRVFDLQKQLEEANRKKQDYWEILDEFYSHWDLTVESEPGDIDLTDDEYDTFITVLAEQRCQHSHADTACPPPPERAILQDLIAALRDIYEDMGGGWDLKEATDRAEARLKGLTDE